MLDGVEAAELNKKKKTGRRVEQLRAIGVCLYVRKTLTLEMQGATHGIALNVGAVQQQ